MRIRGRANLERKRRDRGEVLRGWKDKDGNEVGEGLRKEVERAVKERDKAERGGKLKGGGVKKNEDRGGRGGRRVLGKLGNV